MIEKELERKIMKKGEAERRKREAKEKKEEKKERELKTTEKWEKKIKKEIEKRLKKRRKEGERWEKWYIKKIAKSSQEEGLGKWGARKRALETLEDDALVYKKSRERETEQRIKECEPVISQDQRKNLREKLLKEEIKLEITKLKEKILDDITKKGGNKREIEALAGEAIEAEAEREWKEREGLAEKAEAREKIEKATEKEK